MTITRVSQSTITCHKISSDTSIKSPDMTSTNALLLGARGHLGSFLLRKPSPSYQNYKTIIPTIHIHHSHFSINPSHSLHNCSFHSRPWKVKRQFLQTFHSISTSSTSSSQSSISSRMGATQPDWEQNLDPVQKKLLEEECILLDPQDKVIGHDSKKNCHLVRNDGDVLLHRAFSVFLFNSKGELLLQQRSGTKITFPDLWTNTCCSHPLYQEDELIEGEDAVGIKTAAKRRMEFELGISPSSIDIGDFHYITRIHYKALSNRMWGEHEIDYILFLQKDIPIQPNPEEVSAIRYVTLDQIKNMEKGKDGGVGLTPWFELIYKTWLPLWWNNLKDLKQFEDHKKIHRM